MPEFLQLNPAAPSHPYWDQTLLIDCLPKKGNIVVIPGTDQGNLVDEINDYISKFNRVLVIITTDEEAKFPIHLLNHPDITVWGTYMNYKYEVDRWLPIGYTPHTVKSSAKKRPLLYFFAGQITHPDRVNMIEILKNMEGGEIIQTDGFAKGINPKTYAVKMTQAKFVPCPAGGVNTDSFRVYEALESGAIPITKNPAFWYRLFPDAPFPVVDNWSEMPGVMQKEYDVRDWWENWKTEFKRELAQW